MYFLVQRDEFRMFHSTIQTIFKLTHQIYIFFILKRPFLSISCPAPQDIDLCVELIDRTTGGSHTVQG